MDEYIIGAGVMLASGTPATITRTKVHAEVRPEIAAQARAVAIDFESTRPSELQRLLILAVGWPVSTFESLITGRLLRAGVCGIGDVLRALSHGTGQPEVHLFAHWVPDEVLTAFLGFEGVELVAHPLGEIRRAALIAEQAYTRWERPPQAA